MNIICRNFIEREFEKGKKCHFSPFLRIFDPRKKPRFSIKCGKSVIFQHMWHHRSSKKGQNFKIFYSEVFSSFKGGENKISWSYRSYSLLHITKHRKKNRFSIFRTVVNVAAESKKFCTLRYSLPLSSQIVGKIIIPDSKWI